MKLTRKTSLIKCSDGLWNIPTLHTHLFLYPKGVDFRRTAAPDGFSLFVERFFKSRKGIKIFSTVSIMCVTHD